MSEQPHKIKLFIADLKRRRVTRLATIYAVTGLGFIEAMDIIGGRFLIPDGTVQFLIILILVGFPIAMILGWIYDITPRGIQKTEDLTTQEKASITSLSWKPSWVSVILFVFLVSISFAFFTVPRPNALGFKEQDWILMADLENNTGDEVFDRSLLHALTVTIEQSKRINIYPRNKVLEVLTRMQIDSVEIIDIPLAMEIAERENIKAVLQLSISELGGTYLLIADLLDPYTSATVRSRQVKASGKEHILLALDDLAKIILKDLGESLQNIHLGTVPLLQATTASLDALRFMTKGYHLSGDSDEAYQLYSEAIELDPEFALAHAELGFYYYSINNRIKGEEHFTIALNLLNRLTDKERLWIQAIVSDMRGNREEAVTRWDLFLDEFPNSYPGWFRNGYNYMKMGQYEESIIAFTKANDVYQQKNPDALVNIATCYNALQKYEQSIDFYLEAFDLNPDLLTHSFINNEFGFAYVNMGEPEKARDVFEQMITGSDENKATGYRSLALLSMYNGHLSEAIKQIQESTLIQKARGNELSALRNRLYLAKMYQLKGMMHEFSQELNQVNEVICSVATEPLWYLLLGKMYVRSGEYQKTELLLNEIASRINEGNKWDEAAFKILKGELELAGGNFSEAKDHLETAAILRDDGYSLESLANFYYCTGDFERAKVTNEKICGIRTSLHWEAQECWVRAHFSLGKVHEESGNREQAIIWYQRFLSIWKDADQDLPDFIEAKSRLDNLEKCH